MKIQNASTEQELQEINIFFEKMWKEEFNLDASNQVEYYKKSDIYYISKDNTILSVIIYSKYNNKNAIWRFGTLESHRGKGYGGKLLDLIVNKYEGEFFLKADEKQVTLYKKYGFIETSEKYKCGDTYVVDMLRK